MMWIKTSKNEDQALKAFQEFNDSTKLGTKRNIRSTRFDNGGEFNIIEFT